MSLARIKDGILISNGTIISMKKGEKPYRGDILIKGNRIVKIFRKKPENLPVQKTIDAKGKFIIPALIDSHAHITQMRIMAAPVMDPLYMVTGVTTVRDMATGEPEWDNDDFRLGFDEPDFEGPRIFKVAGFFDGEPGVFSWAIIPETKKEVEEYIAEIVDNKITSIKIYSYMQPEMLKIITKEAEKKGLYVAGHVPVSMNAIEAADAGMQEFEHNFGMPDTILAENDESFFRNMRNFGHRWERVKSRKDDLRKLARDMKKKDITLVPTLVVTRGLGNSNLPDIKNDPRIKYLPDFVPDSIWGKDNPMLQKWTDEDFKLYRDGTDVSGLFTKMCSDEGVKILTGTDSPAAQAFPGFGTHEEMKLLVELSGFSNEEALASATRIPADHMGIGDKLGTIEEGKMADILILDENPLKDISSTEKINSIIFNGRLAERKDIDQQLKDLEEKFHGMMYSTMNFFVGMGSNIGFGFLIPEPPGGWENQ